jgi:phytoene synthase
VAVERAGGRSGAPDDGHTDVSAAARAGEPDRYLAALLAPAPEREWLLALAAFAAELARIPHRALREPLMGEIRLQWWRDVLGLPEAETSGHDVADAVRLAARRHALPAALLGGMIDARALELQPAPFDGDAALDDFLWRTEGALFALACGVVGAAGSDVEPACRAAGRAYGLARLLLGLPRSLSLGRVPLSRTQIAGAGLTDQELLAGADGARVNALMQPYFAQIRGSLAQAHGLVRRLPRGARVSFLPLALVRPYVRVLERQGGGALREQAQIVPLSRVWKVAVAHLFGL